MSKTVVITGASSGIGAETAVTLAAAGFNVVPIGRSQQKLDATVSRMKAAGQDHIVPIQGDLSTLAETRRVTADILEVCPRIDILINNAGVVEKNKIITPEGFESTWAINHLAPFLMTLLLRDRLEHSAPARVITTSSVAANQGSIDTKDIDAQFRGEGFGFAMKTYGATKLANALFSIELARRWEGTSNTSNHVHPGPVNTNWGRDTWWLNLAKSTVGRLIFLSPEQGARSLIYVATDDEGATANGKFFNPKTKTMRALPKASDLNVAGQLWTASEKAVGETWS